MFCFEIAVVSIGGIAVAGSELSFVLPRTSRGAEASACVSLADQPGNIFRFIFDVSAGKLNVIHKNNQNDETRTIVVHCKHKAGVRSFCPFVTFQSPFSLRFNLSHRPCSSAFIESQVPDCIRLLITFEKPRKRAV